MSENLDIQRTSDVCVFSIGVKTRI